MGIKHSVSLIPKKGNQVQQSALKSRPQAAVRGPETAADLWSSYLANHSAEARDALVLHYAGLVTYVASRVGADLPSSVDYSDLIQSGIFGLMDAVDRFEPERGLKFETYAVTRIRGAMIDELRALDWVPRSVRKKARDLTAATETCQERLNRMPTMHELCEELEVTADELHRIRGQVGRTRMAALDELLSVSIGGEDVSLAEALSDPLDEQPGDALDEAELHDALRGAIAELPERYQAVLIHSYFDGFTLAQIGEILGVTESRVCQLRSKALAQVRANLLTLLAD
jgi:RNA polymerase sigma factor for flagellar operon FliA